MAYESTQGRFTQTGDVRPAPGAMNPALGRTSRDLATDQPAGFGPDPIAGTEQDTFSGDDTDTQGRDQPLPGRGHKPDPSLSPDERMGLKPTISGDAAPDTPVNPDLYGS